MNESKNNIKGLSSLKRKRMVFYVVGITLPVLQFCIFYLGVNLNSILLAFKSYTDVGGGRYTFTFAGFSNFKEVFSNFSEYAYLRKSILNSFYAFGFSLIGFVTALFFSYYVFKKFPCSKAFQIFLFLPHILSAVIMFKLYQYFMEYCIPTIFGIESPFAVEGSVSQFILLNVYGIWAGYGTTVMIFVGTMASISDSVFDAAKIDGAGSLREFFSIVIPIIFPTITTFCVVLVSSIFTNQMSLYLFHGLDANPALYTVGYYLFRLTKQAGVSVSQYPYIAALGLIVSAVTIVLTVVIRKLLNKVYK